MRRPDPLPSIEEIRELLAVDGIEHVGVTTADVLTDTRTELRRRKAAGLHDGMGFTYHKPERSTDPRRSVPGARSVIVAARSYLTDTDPPAPSPEEGPHARVGRYAWVDHYAPLRTSLRGVARRIRRADHRAVAFADDNAVVDRAVAHRAGLGWYGKNANLLLPGAGSWFVLGSIVTTAEYSPADTTVGDGCGTCRRCIDDCPTGAIVAPGVIDASRCLSWVLQKPGTIPEHFRAVIHDRVYGCDDCQTACPISVRLGPRATVELDDHADARIDALWLLSVDAETLLERCGHWYIADRDVRWVRRNALVVLGNVGDPADGRVADALEHYRAGIDPILAEHATWSLERLHDRRTARATP